MRLYSLVGKSGTGKSFHAMDLTKKYDIDGIIDDGLFIYQNRVIEGASAKKSSTKVGAIKIALFYSDEMRDKIVSAIEEKKPESMLILATSDKMVDQIIARLKLKGELKRIYIEEITTEEERTLAGIERNVYGKHVVPAPSLQLKRNFAGYFMDPLRYFRGRDVGAAAERTVVRPPFSYTGDYSINETVIDDIVNCAAKSTLGVGKIVKISHYSNPEAYKLSIGIKVKMGYPLWETALEFQDEVHEKVELMTAFNVTTVDVEVKGLV